MKIYAPAYYNQFRCIAGDCRHSCCQGWEVDIDEESLERFRSADGPLGTRLRSSIAYGKGDELPHFILQEGDRCPFLNHEGLCDLIIEKGEGFLCQICTDHPRFRNYWSKRTEIGLGMACEEAARLILGFADPMTLAVIDNDRDPEEDPSQNELDLLELREDLMGVLQDRTMNPDLRMERFLDFCGLTASIGIEYAEILQRDPAEWESFPEWASPAFEQLAVYLLYRNYADALYDGRLGDRLLFVARGYYAIRKEWEDSDMSFDSLVELARSFSNRYEYNIETWGEFFDERNTAYK